LPSGSTLLYAPYQQAASTPVSAAPSPEAPSRPSSPLSAQGFTRLAKLSISAAILFGGVYVTIKFAYPVLRELVHPSGATALHDPNASTGVKVLQQTRQVVAKNNANVEYLNSLIGEVESQPIPDLPASPEPIKPVVKHEPMIQINFKALSASIDQLQINGVIGGQDPRIMVNGMIVTPGGIIDPKLGVKFVGVNEENHVILLEDCNCVVFTKPY
jgi:hypothetical protein